MNASTATSSLGAFSLRSGSVGAGPRHASRILKTSTYLAIIVGGGLGGGDGDRRGRTTALPEDVSLWSPEIWISTLLQKNQGA